MIKYPTWKVKGSPTPYEKLVICDKCGFADWITASVPAIAYCVVPKHGRLREATKKEYEAGKAALKEVIGA